MWGSIKVILFICSYDYMSVSPNPSNPFKLSVHSEHSKRVKPS